MKIYEARSLADFLFLRKLRNAVRFLMTNDTSRITLFQQLCFYRKKPAHIRIFIASSGHRRAGYLLLRVTQDATWITEAVTDHFRGKKIGSTLIEFAKEIYPSLDAEIREDNKPSIRLHESCGFNLISQSDGKRFYHWP